MDTNEKVFSIQDVIDFCVWAEDRYRFEGIILSGDSEIEDLINEYLGFKKENT